MTHSVMCIVPNETRLSTIVQMLRNAGFRESDISILYPDRTGDRQLGHAAASKAPEGAAAGASAGGVLGGLVGLLAGIGTLAIPGVGPFIAAGPIMAALSGVAVGATVGGVGGALIGLGIPEYEAKQYEGRIAAGGILLAVHVADKNSIQTVKDILRDADAQDISVSAEARVPVHMA